VAQTTRHEPRNTASTRPHTELAVADGAQVAPAPLHSWTPVSVRATFLRDGELRPPIRVGTNRSGAGRRRDRVIADLAAKAHADSTRRAYGRHVAKWVDWAEAHGFCPLPAPADAFVEYIVAYTLELDEEGVPLGVEEGAFEGRVVSSTLNQMVSAIALLHSLAGLPSPTHDPYVRGVVKGLRRVLTSAPEYAKVALTWDLMEEVLAAPRAGLTASAARSELVAALHATTQATAGQIARLRRGDVVESDSDIVVTLPPSHRGGSIRRVVVKQRDCLQRLRKALGCWQRVSADWPGETLVRHRSGKPLTRQGVHKALSTPPRGELASESEEFESDEYLRDRTLLLVGWNTALRRTNLAALTWDQLSRVATGWVVYVARSKTDQEGRGTTVGIPCAPEGSDLPDAAVAVDRWLEHMTGILGSDPRRMEGVPVFPRVDRHGRLVIRDGRPVALSDETVNNIVQRWVDAAGLTRRLLVTTGGMPPKAGRNPFGAHSMRAGWITEAKRQNIPDHNITQQTGHKSTRSLMPYVRPAVRPDVMVATAVLAGISASRKDDAEGGDAVAPSPPRRRRSIAW
jgi:integrase